MRTSGSGVPGSRVRSSGAGSAVVRTTVHHLVRTVLAGGAGCRVLDVGGGSGVWAVPLATVGAQVTVIDASPDALASLARRAREAGVSHLVRGLQGDADAFEGVLAAGCAEVILVHGVLEVVDDVVATLGSLSGALCPGGTMSVLVAGRPAAVLHRALAGRVADARRVLADPDGRVGPEDPLRRRFDVAGLSRALRDAGLRIDLVQGDGVVADLVPTPVLETTPGAVAELDELELEACRTSPLREMASRLHAVAVRP